MIVFIVSTVLHLVLMYIFHRFNHRDRIFPKSSKENSTMKPVLQVPYNCSKELSTKLAKRYHLIAPDAIEISPKLPTVPHKNNNSEPNLQAATSFSPAALIPANENGTLIAVTAIAPQQEGHYATIEKKQETPA